MLLHTDTLVLADQQGFTYISSVQTGLAKSDGRLGSIARKRERRRRRRRGGREMRERESVMMMTFTCFKINCVSRIFNPLENTQTYQPHPFVKRTTLSFFFSIYTSLSSSCAICTDFPDSLSPSVSIIHRFRLVFQALSCVRTELLLISST